MNIMSVTELEFLAKIQKDPCASIYLSLPPSGEPSNQARIKLKNALRELETLADKGGFHGEKRISFMGPIHAILMDVPFWKSMDTSLAIFRSEAGILYFWLPAEIRDLVVFSDRFHIKPLINFFGRRERFYLLALSLNQVRLFVGSRHSLRAVEVMDMPSGLKKTLNYEERERTLQRPRSGPSGKGSVHGAGYELVTSDIMKYFRVVDKTISEALPDKTLPLVIAAVDREIPMYMKVSVYPNIVKKGLPGNPEGMSERELHTAAMGIMEPYFKKAEQEAFSEYHEEAGSGKVSHKLREILPMAVHGRVKILFVPKDHRQWGRFNYETETIDMHNERAAGDHDLFDFAAYHTILAGGGVYVLDPSEIPGGDSAAAVFRY